MRTDHADLLNALSDMQASPAYALRREVLYRAETLIANQEQRIKALEGLLNDLLDNGSCYISAIELAHNFDGEKWEARALPLLGRTQQGNA